jgi:thioredoxin-like negative regulator of GroEL
MSVHRLTAQNFHLVGQQKQSLHINFGGNVLVFFKSQGCNMCAAFEPIFYQFAAQENRVTMAVVDLTYNRNIVHLSRGTTTPIEGTPRLILYVQGRPHALFKGERNLHSLITFISGALQTIADRQVSTFVPYQPPYNGGISAVNPVVSTGFQDYNNQPGMYQDTPGSGLVEQCNMDTGQCVMIPKHIIPHNMPWEAEKKAG